MSAVETKFWSDEELLALPKDGHDHEIIHGELYMSPASADHGGVISELLTLLNTHVRKNKLGKILDGQTGFRMQSGDLYSPDISFMSAPRWLAHKATKSVFIQGAPDLAVEVLSPSDTTDAIETKIAQYFENGTRLLWVINLYSRTAIEYRNAQPTRLIKKDEPLDGLDVVPGFTLPLQEIFE